MTLLFADGFDWWDDSSPDQIYQLHTDSINTIDTDTRYSKGRALHTTSSSGHTLRKIIPRTTTLVAGFAYYMQPSGAGDNKSIFCTAAGTGVDNGPRLQKLGSGPDFLRLQVGGTFIAQTAASLEDSVWYYIEMKVEAAAAGAYEIRVNGDVWLSGTADLRPGGGSFDYIDMVGFGIGGLSFHEQRIDDFYVCDTSGTTNNDFLGAVRINALFPNKDSSTDWINSNGNSNNNYQMVNEIPTDNETTTVYSITPGQQDIYDCDDLESDVDEIFAVINHSQSARTGTQVTYHSNILRSQNVTYTGQPHLASVTTQDFITNFDIYETNPNTGSGWLQTQINAIEIGNHNRGI